MRVAGAICQVCAVPLSEWIVFEQDDGRLRTLASDRQARLDLLMAKNSAGQMTEAERSELRQAASPSQRWTRTAPLLPLVRRCHMAEQGVRPLCLR